MLKTIDKANKDKAKIQKVKSSDDFKIMNGK